jgi:hypothetical protein
VSFCFKEERNKNNEASTRKLPLEGGVQSDDGGLHLDHKGGVHIDDGGVQPIISPTY